MVVIMTSGSNTAKVSRLASARPASAPNSTIGIKKAAICRCWGWIRPSEIVKGSLERLTRKKNQAVVPKKVFTLNLQVKKYMLVTGSPALATIVVNPAKAPAMARIGLFAGILVSLRRRCQIVNTTKSNKIMPIDLRICTWVTKRIKIAPATTPVSTETTRRRSSLKLASWR